MMSWPGGTLYSPTRGYKKHCNIRERKAWEQKLFPSHLLVDTTQAVEDQTLWPWEIVVIAFLLSSEMKRLNSQSSSRNIMFWKIQCSGKWLCKIHTYTYTYFWHCNTKYFDILQLKICVWMCPLESLLLLLGPSIQVPHVPSSCLRARILARAHVPLWAVTKWLPEHTSVPSEELLVPWKRACRKGPQNTHLITGSSGWKVLPWSS